MEKPEQVRPIKSKWDARFLINTIMGLLESQKTFDGDVIMGVVTAAVRGYSRAYFGGMDLKKEFGVYCALKKYALERAQRGGNDSELMKAFLKTIEFAEHDMAQAENEQHLDSKLSAGFPLDCFTEEEVILVSEKSQEHFGAKFYCSDGEPKTGMLVFQDDGGLEAFGEWMAKNHPELIHENTEDCS